MVLCSFCLTLYSAVPKSGGGHHVVAHFCWNLQWTQALMVLCILQVLREVTTHLHQHSVAGPAARGGGLYSCCKLYKASQAPDSAAKLELIPSQTYAHFCGCIPFLAAANFTSIVVKANAFGCSSMAVKNFFVASQDNVALMSENQIPQKNILPSSAKRGEFERSCHFYEGPICLQYRWFIFMPAGPSQNSLFDYSYFSYSRSFSNFLGVEFGTLVRGNHEEQPGCQLIPHSTNGSPKSGTIYRMHLENSHLEQFSRLLNSVNGSHVPLPGFAVCFCAFTSVIIFHGRTGW